MATETPTPTALDEQEPLSVSSGSDAKNSPYFGYFMLLKTENPEDADSFVRDQIGTLDGPSAIATPIEYHVGELTLENLKVIKFLLEQDQHPTK